MEYCCTQSNDDDYIKAVSADIFKGKHNDQPKKMPSSTGPIYFTLAKREKEDLLGYRK
jgi:hypothetical protein